jgi:hypothetical protein
VRTSPYSMAAEADAEGLTGFGYLDILRRGIPT